MFHSIFRDIKDMIIVAKLTIFHKLTALRLLYRNKTCSDRIDKYINIPSIWIWGTVSSGSRSLMI